VRRLVIVSLAACGCSRAAAPLPDEASAPPVWVESEPDVDPDDPIEHVDTRAWSGVWTEYFPDRPICQDRFTIRAFHGGMQVESIDCTNDQPYTISDVSWDGRTLRFIAVPPGSGFELRYSIEMQAPGQAAGTANETAITWSRVED